MKKLTEVAGPPLLKGQTVIIERGLIHKKPHAAGIWPKHINVLRSEIEDLLKLAFVLVQVGIKAGVLQRNCGLRTQQFQHGNPVRCEGAPSEVVLQIKCADKLRLLDDGQAQDGL